MLSKADRSQPKIQHIYKEHGLKPMPETWQL